MRKASHRAWFLFVLTLSAGLCGPVSLGCLGRAELSYWDSLAAADRVVVAEVQDLWASRSLRTRARCWVRQVLVPSHDLVVRLGHWVDRGFGILAEEHWPEDAGCYIPRDLHARLRVEENLKGQGTSWLAVKMTEGGETFLVPGERLVVLLRERGRDWWPVGTYRSTLLARDQAELAEVVGWVREGLARQAAGATAPAARWRLRALTLPTLATEELSELSPADFEWLARQVSDLQILGDSLAIVIESFRDRPNARVDAALAQLLEAELATAQRPMRAENMMAALMARIGAADLYTQLAEIQSSRTSMADSQARWSEAKRSLSLETALDPDLLARSEALRAWKDGLVPRWRRATESAERHLR